MQSYNEWSSNRLRAFSGALPVGATRMQIIDWALQRYGGYINKKELALEFPIGMVNLSGEGWQLREFRIPLVRLRDENELIQMIAILEAVSSAG